MTGTLLNMATILIGSLIGVRIGDRLPGKMQESIMGGLGLVTFVVGLQDALHTGNILIPLFSLLIGIVVGELLDLDGALKRFGGWLQAQAGRVGRSATVSVNAIVDPPIDPAEAELRDAHTELPHTLPLPAHDSIAVRARFINGFVTASLVFCIGPLTILGSIQNGMDAADIKLLAIKSTLDFFASIAFASSLGIGVAFSIVPTFVIQGGFTVFGVALARIFIAGANATPLTGDNSYIRELTATGGLLLLGIALLLLNIKQLRVANFLPALLIAPLLLLIAGLLGINVYPL